MVALGAVQEVIRSQVEQFRQSGVGIATQCGAADGWELTPREATLLGTAVRCLLENACEAVAGTPCPRLEVATSTRGRRLRIAFRNSGRAIAEDELTEVFEPFYTTKPDHPGLGLPICREAVRRLGGDVFVASAGDDGVEIVIELPRYGAPQARA